MIRFTIKSNADQKFSTILNDRRVTLRLWYSVRSNRWSLDLAIDGAPVLNGKRVVTGVDLLAGHGFDLGVVFAHSANGDEPGRTELPEGLVRLYHASEDEKNAAVSS